MTMLEEYSKAYYQSNIQFVLADSQGEVLEVSPGFLTIKENTSIVDLHPFFNCLPALVDSEDKAQAFDCIQLTIDGKAYYTNIRTLVQENTLVVAIHNLTDFYEEYQKVAQSRNETVINKELIILKNKELEEREYFKNQFIQNFSHELRNPLTSMLLTTQLLAKSQLDNNQKQMLGFLEDSGKTLRLLLEDILNMGMINSGKLQLREQLFSLEKLFDVLEYQYQPKAANKGLGFNLVVEENVPEYVEGDKLRLNQVLGNLLENAIKYTDKGEVSLKVSLNQIRANKMNLRFEIEDTGVGVAEEARGSIFESFSRLESTSKAEGIGLGLPIVKGLLEVMDSAIQLESTVGNGSRFFFDLTLKTPLPTTLRAQGKKKVIASIDKKPQEQEKAKILIVEDNERIQLALFKLMVEDGTYYFDLIDDGAKALQAILDNTYDLVLMDVNLPNLSGDQLTRLVRELPSKELSRTPIIGLTANAYQKDIKTYLDMGMNAVLTKPFDERELLITLKKHIKK